MTWHDSDDKSAKTDQSDNDDVWNRHKKRQSQGPPDLDKLFSDFFAKLGRLFGGGGRSNHAGGQGSSSYFAAAGFIILLVLWGIAGFFIVDPAEQAVITRFGQYETTVGPGPHWIPQLIERKSVVNVQQVHTFSYDADMLTKDKNIVTVSIAIHYRIADPKAYLFNVVSPEESLHQATASALRQVIGTTTLDEVITTGRAAVRQHVTEQLDKILALYRSGLMVTDVTLQPARAPEAVKAAFDDAIKALEDEQRFINQAQAYARDVIPKAEGQAKRLLAEARAYKTRVVLQAKGDTARYLALLPSYQAAPKLLRMRLYMDTMQSVLGKSQTVLVNLKKGRPLLYLPLDKLKQGSASDAVVAAEESVANTDTAKPTNVVERGGYFSED
ncbi:MAG: protease modulator HflK [marine bacterium B5-7]|nr:MAG: protease modulator HflK [marine bacterium B5-7]